jgi:hypothetical protein
MYVLFNFALELVKRKPREKGSNIPAAVILASLVISCPGLRCD